MGGCLGEDKAEELLRRLERGTSVLLVETGTGDPDER